MLSVDRKSSKTRYLTALKSFVGLIGILVLLGNVGKAQTANLNPRNPLQQCFRIDGAGNKSRVIASDNNQQIVYIFDGESKITAFDLQSKTSFWIYDVPGHFESLVVKNNDYLFIVTKTELSGSSSHTLSAVSLKTGLTKWKTPFTSIRSLLLSSGGMILIESEENNLTALNPQTGTTNWKISLKESPRLLINSQNSNLHVLDSQFLYEVNVSNGEIISKLRLPIGFEDKYAALLVSAKSYLIGGNSKGTIQKVSLQDSNGNWSFKAGGGISFTEDTKFGVLVFSLDNFVYLFDPRNGNILWKKRVSDRINIKPLTTDNLVLITSAGSQNAFIIELENGQIINKISVDPENYIIDKPSLLNNLLMLPTTKGILVYSFEGCR